MPTSDEELEQLKESVEAKRQSLADARLDRETKERELSNDLVVEQLKAEEARLDADLALVARRAQAEAVEGGASPLDVAREEMKRAVAAREAAEAPPPDSGSNSDSQEKEN